MFNDERFDRLRINIYKVLIAIKRPFFHSVNLYVFFVVFEHSRARKRVTISSPLFDNIRTLRKVIRAH